MMPLLLEKQQRGWRQLPHPRVIEFVLLQVMRRKTKAVQLMSTILKKEIMAT